MRKMSQFWTKKLTIHEKGYDKTMSERDGDRYKVRKSLTRHCNKNDNESLNDKKYGDTTQKHEQNGDMTLLIRR